MVGTEAGKTGLQRPEILSGAQRGPGPPRQHLHRQTPSQQREDTVSVFSGDTGSMSVCTGHTGLTS